MTPLNNEKPVDPNPNIDQTTNKTSTGSIKGRTVKKTQPNEQLNSITNLFKKAISAIKDFFTQVFSSIHTYFSHLQNKLFFEINRNREIERKFCSDFLSPNINFMLTEKNDDNTGLAQHSLKTDFDKTPPSSDKPEIIGQFKLDIPRGVFFTVSDKGKTKDNFGFKNLEGKSKIKKSGEVINSTLSSAEDKKWSSALQIAASQRTHNALFGDLIALTNPAFMSQENCNWQGTLGKSSEGHLGSQTEFSLKIGYPKKLPPVNLVINRNSSDKIESISVSYKASLDLLQFTPIKGHSIGTYSTQRDVVKGELTYQITLDETKNKFVISNCHISLIA